jgi:hypothetical protein
MSWQAMKAVNRHSKLPQKEFRLLMELADRANAEGHIDPAPSQETLAETFGCTDRTIRAWIGRLCESGELEQTRIGSGPGNPSAYKINLPMSSDGQSAEAKGGNKAEDSTDFASTFTKEMAALKVEILALKVEVSELKVEKVEAKGGKGGSERWKDDSFKSADDPSFDPIKTKEKTKEEDPPTPQPAQPTPKAKREPKAKSGLVFNIPANLDTPEFRQVFTVEWVAARLENKSPLTQRAVNMQLDDLAKYTPAEAVAVVKQSIMNQWKAFYPLKDKSNGSQQRPKMTSRPIPAPDSERVGGLY